MPESWTYYLSKYDYPVRLSEFKSAHEYPSHFQLDIKGDRESTVSFEDYFRENMQDSIEVYFEVVFWKYFSQPQFRQRGTGRIVEHLREYKVEAINLHSAIMGVINNPCVDNLKKLRWWMGISSKVLAVPMTLISFTEPESFPMVDNVVASWVNRNYNEYNENVTHKLTPYQKKYTSLQDNDFDNYLNWVNWCREIAETLTDETGSPWRARDVEMTVFTFERMRKKAAMNHPPLTPL